MRQRSLLMHYTNITLHKSHPSPNIPCFQPLNDPPSNQDHQPTSFPYPHNSSTSSPSPDCSPHSSDRPASHSSYIRVPHFPHSQNQHPSYRHPYHRAHPVAHRSLRNCSFGRTGSRGWCSAYWLSWPERARAIAGASKKSADWTAVGPSGSWLRGWRLHSDVALRP